MTSECRNTLLLTIRRLLGCRTYRQHGHFCSSLHQDKMRSNIKRLLIPNVRFLLIAGFSPMMQLYDCLLKWLKTISNLDYTEFQIFGIPCQS